jgi:membrane fusion protein, multidrug efflux system
MQVDVATRNDSGSQLGAAVNTRYQTDVYAQQGAQADAEIAKIIDRNRVPLAGVTPVAAAHTPAHNG